MATEMEVDYFNPVWNSVLVASLRSGHDIAESIANADAAEAARLARLKVVVDVARKRLRDDTNRLPWVRSSWIKGRVWRRGNDTYNPRTKVVYDWVRAVEFKVKNWPSDFGDPP